MRLAAIDAGADVEALARSLTPAFGGDRDASLEILTQTIALLTAKPRPDPWGSYLAFDEETAIGTCAFKTAPDADGIVEIAYMTFPAFKGRGHATAMAGALYDIAREAGGLLVIAHTLPQENASNRALKRNGFAFAGEVIDPEDGLVWRWEK